MRVPRLDLQTFARSGSNHFGQRKRLFLERRRTLKSAQFRTVRVPFRSLSFAQIFKSFLSRVLLS